MILTVPTTPTLVPDASVASTVKKSSWTPEIDRRSLRKWCRRARRRRRPRVGDAFDQQRSTPAGPRESELHKRKFDVSVLSSDLMRRRPCSSVTTIPGSPAHEIQRHGETRHGARHHTSPCS